MLSWDFHDAVAVALLIHKYDEAIILPGLNEALANNTPKARQLFSLEVAE